MALINCSECNNQISSLAASCPYCGAPALTSQGINTPLATIQLTSKRLKIQLAISATIFLVALFWFVAAAFAFKNGVLYSTNSYAVGGIVLVAGIIWHITTKIRIWWHHE